MLGRLPNELWESVIAEIVDSRDLNSLSRVSKTVHDRTIPFLYRDLIVRPLSESRLGDIDVSKLLETNSSEQKPLHYATSFRIVAGFATRIERRCVHYDAQTWNAESATHFDTSEESHESANAETTAEHPTLQSLADRVVSLMRCFPDGQLRSFTWDLGLCMPARLLGRDGYLTLHQNGIESLRLITDAGCWLGDRSLALDQFQRLKRFSWTGLRTELDFVSLNGVFENCARHLVEFEVDFIDWEELKDNHPIEVLLRKIPRSSMGCRFPALERLSLSNLDLRSATRMMASALNSPHLRSLALRQCPGWDRFLQCLLEHTGQLHVQSLEVQNSSLDDDDYYDSSIQTILESLVGVEELYLSLWCPDSSRMLWETLQRQKESLKRFIFQARSINLDEESEHFEAAMDVNDMGFLSPAFLATFSGSEEDYEDGADDTWFDETHPNPLNELDLECLGLACAPHRLQEVLKPFADKACLRILHVRQSGADIERFGSWVSNTLEVDAVYYAGQPPGKHVISHTGLFSWASLPSRNHTVTVRVLTRDFLDFAAWVFGPNGISSLEVLIYGDFSCHGRYLDSSFMLRRKKPTEDGQMPWKWHDPKRGRHPDMEDLLHRHAGFLEACPTDTIMHC